MITRDAFQEAQRNVQQMCFEVANDFVAKSRADLATIEDKLNGTRSIKRDPEVMRAPESCAPFFASADFTSKSINHG
jgi:hypothetical protein